MDNRRVTMLLLLTCLAGCGSRCSLSGTVSVRPGKKVVSGTVTAIGGDGVPRQGPIAPDGTYSVAGLPPGAVRLTVSSPKPGGKEPRTRKGAARIPGARPHEKAKAEPPPEEAVRGWFPIPARYALPDTSGLTAELRAGPNTRHLALE